MSLIAIPYIFASGNTIIASQHNLNFSTIVNDYNGNIQNVNLSGSAGITYANLSLGGNIVNADISASAGIVASKLVLTSPGAIGSVAPSTGAFTTLNVGTTNQGDILYDNGTSFVRLPHGTSGQFLKTQGASANPIWATAGSVVLVSTTPITGASTTGVMSLTNGNNYFIEFEFHNWTSGGTLGLMINQDTAGHYKYINTYQTTSSTTAVIASNSASASVIQIGTTIPSSSTTGIMGSFYIQQIGSSQIYRVWGQFVQDGSSLFTAGNFYGTWADSLNLTDIELVASAGNMDGVATIYQLKTS